MCEIIGRRNQYRNSERVKMDSKVNEIFVIAEAGINHNGSLDLAKQKAAATINGL